MLAHSVRGRWGDMAAEISCGLNRIKLLHLIVTDHTRSNRRFHLNAENEVMGNLSPSEVGFLETMESFSFMFVLGKTGFFHQVHILHLHFFPLFPSPHCPELLNHEDIMGHKNKLKIQI